MNNFYPAIFVPVDVNERLPEKLGTYNCIHGNIKRLPDAEPLQIGFGELEEVGEEKQKKFPRESISEWIEPLSNKYVLSEEQLKKIWQAARDRGFDFGIKGLSSRPNFEEYLKFHQ